MIRFNHIITENDFQIIGKSETITTTITHCFKRK